MLDIYRLGPCDARRLAIAERDRLRLALKAWREQMFSKRKPTIVQELETYHTHALISHGMYQDLV